MLTLKTKTVEEVTYHLLDIYCLFGAPLISKSDNGREKRICKLCSKKYLTKLWPSLKLVHGKLRHLQIEGSVDRYNQDV